ncbi:MAG: AEC family transporter [Burkholderiaceae bacterium]
MNGVFLMLPDFALIAIGVVLARRIRFPEGFWSGVEKLVYFVLFPALLFYTISTARFSLESTQWFLITGLAAMSGAVALGFLGHPLLRTSGTVVSSSVQTAFRFNSYVGFALASSLYGTEGLALMALITALWVPIGNLVAVSSMAGQSQQNIWGELARNPLILATLTGLVFNLSGLSLPDPGAVLLKRLGDASLALGLLAIGAGLRFSAARGFRAVIAWFVTVRLALVPALALGLALLAGLSPLELQVLVLFAALPTSPTCYILAVRMNGHGPAVAAIITAQTVLAMFTLPLWATASSLF